MLSAFVTQSQPSVVSRLLVLTIILFGLLSPSPALVYAAVSAAPATPTGWNIQTVDAGGKLSAMRLDSHSYPHFVYFQNNTLKYAFQDATGYHTQVVELNAHPSLTCRSSIALDQNDQPHLSYYSGGKVVYASLPGASWITETVGLAANPSSTSIAIDPVSGGPGVSYDSGNFEVHNLLYAFRTPTGWVGNTVDSNLAGMDSSLAFDSGGAPHISYISLSGVTYASLIPQVGLWDIQWVAGNVGFVQGTWLTMDHNQKPHLSYYDSTVSAIMYAKEITTTWSVQTVITYTSVGAASDSSIMVDATGRPYIAYINLDQDQLQLAYWNNTHWRISNVTNPAIGGAHPNVAFDSSGNIHIGFYESVGNSLKHAVGDGPIFGLAAANDGPTIPGASTHLTATVTTGSNVSYAWAFGDGAHGSGAVTAHMFPSAGWYTAVVTATNSMNQITASTMVSVTDKTIAGLIATSNSPTGLGSTTTLTATITAGSNVTYTWDFGDSQMGVGSLVAHIYPAAGPYTATVTASNSKGFQTAITHVMILPTYKLFLPLIHRGP